MTNTLNSHRSRRLGALAASLVLLASVTSSSARANGHLGRAFGMTPTEYVVATPTSFLVATDYLVPTVATAWVPTVHATTYVARSYLPAYVTPTVYLAETSLPVYSTRSYVIPTVSYLPTSYVTTSVALATSCDIPIECNPCGDLPRASIAASVAPTPSSVAPARSAPPKSEPLKGESSAVNPPPASLESEPSTVTESTAKRPGTGGQPPVVDPGLPTPPAAPAAERDLGVTPLGSAPEKPAQPPASPPVSPAPAAEPPAPVQPATPPAPAAGLPEPTVPAAPGGVKPPVAPGGDPAPVELPPPGEAETLRRDAQKPAYSTVARPAPYLRSARKGNLNWLEGKVVASDSGRPEEGVKITLGASRPGSPELVVVTDDAGRYGVRLPDGKWTVRVTMPSGRVYSVSQLVVEKGQISDDQGRSIPTLTITR